jgi:hypothetical protein
MKDEGDIGKGTPEPIRQEATRRGYLARELVQCTLPHSDPKDLEAFSRQDGNLTLGIRSGYDHSKKKRIGLPYGSIPRLLLLWMTSEAVRTNNPKLELGNHLNEFLRIVGLDPKTGGGKRGDAKRLKEQMIRLFRAEISFEYSEGSQAKGGEAWLDMKVAPKGVLWWDFDQPEERLLFDSYIILGEDFFKAITKNPVPIDLTIAGKLKRSPLAIDLFVWTTYRLFRMKEGEKVTISYQDLKEQFGSNYDRMDNFKAAIRDGLAMVAKEWEPLTYDLSHRGLVLTGIPKAQLPIKEKIKGGILTQKFSSGPFALSTAELMKAEDFAPGWDVRALKKDWERWCKKQGITPEKPLAHFIEFLKTHKKQNG